MKPRRVEALLMCSLQLSHIILIKSLECCEDWQMVHLKFDDPKMSPYMEKNCYEAIYSLKLFIL